MNHLIQVPHIVNGNMLPDNMQLFKAMFFFTKFEIAIWWLCKSFLWFLVWGEKGVLCCDMAAVSWRISLIAQFRCVL
jgi:hypothetical protein